MALSEIAKCVAKKHKELLWELTKKKIVLYKKVPIKTLSFNFRDMSTRKVLNKFLPEMVRERRVFFTAKFYVHNSFGTKVSNY